MTQLILPQPKIDNLKQLKQEYQQLADVTKAFAHSVATASQVNPYNHYYYCYYYIMVLELISDLMFRLKLPLVNR